MSLRGLEDPLVGAVLLLLQEGTNAALRGQLQEDAIQGTIGYPLPRGSERGPRQSRPLLSVWRQQEIGIARQTTILQGNQVNQQIRIRIDYEDSAAARQNPVNERWPLLAAVWTEFRRLLIAGCDSEVLDGAAILSDAGVQDIDPLSLAVTYLPPPDGETLYPRFEAVANLTWRQDAVVETFDPWSLLANVEGVDTSAEGNPLAAEILVSDTP